MLNMGQLLLRMVQSRGSDLHLAAGAAPQMRQAGQLVDLEAEKLTADAAKQLAYTLLTPEQVARFERDKELDFSYSLPGVSRFRVNLYMQRSSVALVARAIPHVIPTMEQLALPPIVGQFAEKSSGLVLLSGATGSGKSTTMAAMIDSINKRKRATIVCIEDPIEYLHRHNLSTITQRQIGEDTVSFQAAMKHVMRQDPDVVVVGEMRDLETIQAALTLAETGHLILATVHSASASNTIGRIVDVFPPNHHQQVRVQLSLTLIGIIVQQLIPRADGSGLALALEILNATPSIQTLIRENQMHQVYSQIQTGKTFGMKTMNQSLSELMRTQTIAPAEGFARSPSVQELSGLLSGGF